MFEMGFQVLKTLTSVNAFLSSSGYLNVDELNPDLISGFFSHISSQNSSRRTKSLHLVFLTNIFLVLIL